MSQAIYKLWQGRFTEAWHQLPEEDRRRLLARVQEALPAVGAKTVAICTAGWSNEAWPFFGLEEFPDLDALQKHTQILTELNWSRYLESRTTIGTRLASEP